MQGADGDSVSWLRFIFASVTVLGLMALLAWVLKYYSMRGPSTRRLKLGKWLGLPDATKASIQVLSSLPIDGRRRLVIAKCEDIEYHLLLGPNNDVVLSRKFTCPPPAQDSSDSCSTVA